MSLQLTIDMVAITCGHADCDMVFMMPKRWYEKRCEDHKSWYCPNGHCRSFLAESDKERLERAARRAQELLDQERRSHEITKNLRLAAEEESTRLNKKVRRLKKRAAAGCCPCCQRNFGNLAAHMKTKHPDFAKTPG